MSMEVIVNCINCKGLCLNLIPRFHAIRLFQKKLFHFKHRLQRFMSESYTQIPCNKAASNDNISFQASNDQRFLWEPYAICFHEFKITEELVQRYNEYDVHRQLHKLQRFLHGPYMRLFICLEGKYYYLMQASIFHIWNL